MSVTSEITRLYGVRSDIFTAITNKGVTVPSGSQLDDCPTLIGQISGGSPAPSLPAKTLRLRFADGITPTFNYGTGVQVTSSPNVWDWTYNNTNWHHGLGSLNGLIEVEAAGDTSGVTNMHQLFYDCITLSTVCMFDTSDVTDMGGMFSGCKALTSVPTFDTSSVTDMSNMFAYCVSLYTIPALSTGSVTTMQSLFEGCENLHSIPLLNTSSVTNMGSMFATCISLSSVPLLNTQSVTDMNNMFYGCVGLQSVPQFVTSNVTDMSNMFATCTSLTTIPLFDTSSVSNMNGFCYNCSALTAIPLFDTSSVDNMDNAFYFCIDVQSGSLALYQQASTQTNPPTYHDAAFYAAGNNTQTGYAELEQIPSSWGGLAE